MSPTNANRQRIFAIGVLLVAVILLLFADTELRWKKGAAFHLQPGFWSVLALAGMAGFALAQLAMPPWRWARQVYFDFGAWLRDWFGPVEYMAWFLLYVYLVPRLGYLPSTLLVFPLLVLRAGYRGWRYVGLAWIVGIVIVVLFKSLLQVKIPGGEIYGLFPDAIRNFLVLRL